MNLNYVDEDNCPVNISLTLRELRMLIEATDETGSHIHKKLVQLQTDAIKQGQFTFGYWLSQLEDDSSQLKDDA